MDARKRRFLVLSVAVGDVHLSAPNLTFFGGPALERLSRTRSEEESRERRVLVRAANS